MTSTPLPKRLFDLVGATAGLLAFSPVMAAIASAILLEDGWPILFRQERLGRGRRPFAILKFRSMRDGCRWAWIAGTWLVRPWLSTCAWWQCRLRSTRSGRNAFASFWRDRVVRERRG